MSKKPEDETLAPRFSSKPKKHKKKKLLIGFKGRRDLCFFGCFCLRSKSYVSWNYKSLPILYYIDLYLLEYHCNFAEMCVWPEPTSSVEILDFPTPCCSKVPSKNLRFCTGQKTSRTSSDRAHLATTIWGPRGHSRSLFTLVSGWFPSYTLIWVGFADIISLLQLGVTHYCRRGEVFIRKSGFLIGNYRVFEPITLVDIMVFNSSLVSSSRKLFFLKGNYIYDWRGPCFTSIRRKGNKLLRVGSEGKEKNKKARPNAAQKWEAGPKAPAQTNKVCLSSS